MSVRNVIIYENATGDVVQLSRQPLTKPIPVPPAGHSVFEITTVDPNDDSDPGHLLFNQINAKPHHENGGGAAWKCDGTQVTPAEDTRPQLHVAIANKIVNTATAPGIDLLITNSKGVPITPPSVTRNIVVSRDREIMVYRLTINNGAKSIGKIFTQTGHYRILPDQTSYVVRGDLEFTVVEDL